MSNKLKAYASLSGIRSVEEIEKTFGIDVKSISFMLLSCFLISCRSSNLITKNHQISKVEIFKFEPINGSTIKLYNHVYKITKDSVNTFDKIIVDLEVFRNRIRESKVRKHFQQKIAGVKYGGYCVVDTSIHYFIYLPETKTLINFTDKRNYLLKEGLVFQ